MNDKFFEMIGVTSGPWKANEFGGSQEFPMIIDYPKDDYSVADYIKRPDSSLIAAAPEMLEALIISTIRLIEIDKQFFHAGVDAIIKHNSNIIEKATNKPIDEVLRLWEESCEN